MNSNNKVRDISIRMDELTNIDQQLTKKRKTLEILKTSLAKSIIRDDILKLNQQKKALLKPAKDELKQSKQNKKSLNLKLTKAENELKKLKKNVVSKYLNEDKIKQLENDINKLKELNQTIKEHN